METSTSQIIDKMKKNFEEKMGVLEADNHILKDRFVNLNDPTKNIEKRGKKDVP